MWLLVAYACHIFGRSCPMCNSCGWCKFFHFNASIVRKTSQ